MDNVHEFKPRKPKNNNNPIKPIHFAVVIFLLALGGIYYTMENSTPTGIKVDGIDQFNTPKTMPEITFQGMNGKTHQLSDFKGNVVLLHFWATWCPPCIDEMPELEFINRTMAGNDFILLPISIDSGIENKTIRDFMLQHKSYSLVPYFDPKHHAYAATQNAMNSRGLPYTVIINKEGKAVGEVIGALLWSRPEVEKYLHHYLQE